VLPENPFPGLRSFEQQESALFFGRDEQCDDLLTRMSRRRLVAVVGVSGSGKSSLVRAGLLPALERGYLPSAGSSWHIAVFRPGSEPLANLADALASRRLPDHTSSADRAADIREVLDSSSLGLVAASRLLLRDPADSLLIVADQFEEIFRFARIASGRAARDQAAACVDLLVNASQQDDVRVYVVLTMRSDYLGDCAEFIGLPEALNDGQFLVPRMTRIQLRAAIEGPVSVCHGVITLRLVHQLLDDVDAMGAAADDDSMPGREGQDHLPVLQHAMMRMWNVSPEITDTQGQRKALDLPHYHSPPVGTLIHALDLHAEEIYAALPTDRHREVARLVFQQLTDRDAENRDVRRPTKFGQLAAVALRRAPEDVSAADVVVVQEVLNAFSGEGRGFVVVNAQQDVDISHESFIRRWVRLRQWVDEENQSRRIYMRLAETASDWARKKASLYRGPELVEARAWWQRQAPTALWAERYDRRFETARQFLTKSIARRRLGLAVLFGNLGLLLATGVVIAVLMVNSRNQALQNEQLARRAEAEARRAEEAALEVRATTERAKQEQEEATKLFADALAAERSGQSALADKLAKQAEQIDQQAKDRPVLTPGELSELERLRKEEGGWKSTEASLRQQITSLQAKTGKSEPPADPSPAGELAKLQQQLKDASDRATKAEQTAAALDQQLRTANDLPRIYRLLHNYKAAFESRDARAVVRLAPSYVLKDLEQMFSGIKAYTLEIGMPQIDITGDTAVVTFVQRQSIVPNVGRAPNAETVLMTLRLKRVSGDWVVLDHQLKRIGQNE
jgi:hypothetical protein